MLKVSVFLSFFEQKNIAYADIVFSLVYSYMIVEFQRDLYYSRRQSQVKISKSFCGLCRN
jgi:hypothetical protein